MKTRVGSTLLAWNALLHAHEAVVEAVEERTLREAGIPLSWHEVLAHAADAGEHGMRMQELARTVLLSKSGLTRLTDRMEEAGLVERRACSTDRRGTYVAVTERGREVLAAARPVFTAAVAEHLGSRLSPEEVEALIEILDRLGPPAAPRPTEPSRPRPVQTGSAAASS